MFPTGDGKKLFTFANLLVQKKIAISKCEKFFAIISYGKHFAQKTHHIRSSDADPINTHYPVTGKSLSEAHIFASTNPQYDDRLFIELQVQYMKIASSEHVVYINSSECQNKNKIGVHNMFSTCSRHVLGLQFSCTELVIQ